MFTVNAEQKSMYGMMNQGMRMDMCMYMSMFCCALCIRVFLKRQPSR